MVRHRTRSQGQLCARQVGPAGSRAVFTGRRRARLLEPGRGRAGLAVQRGSAGQPQWARRAFIRARVNQSFETAALDAARLSASVQFRGSTIIFTWPSKEKLLDYGYDRESAMWSRDALQELLEALVRNAMVRRVHVVAHSMGALLAVESLKQLWTSGGTGDVEAHLGAIVLAAPDIDIDLFAASTKRMGRLAGHITVIGSTGDRALAVSGRLAGGVVRAGATDRERLEPLGVQVVDASDYGNWRLLRHDLFLSNEEVRGVVRRAIERAGPA